MITANKVNNLAFYAFTFKNLTNGKDKGAINLDTMTNFAFRWNTTLNCVDACIAGGHNDSSIVDSNTFNGMHSPGSETGAPSGPVWFVSNSDCDMISHNLVENNNGMGFGINGSPQNDSYNWQSDRGCLPHRIGLRSALFYEPGSPA